MPIKENQIALNKFLKKHNISRSEIKHHIEEFYPNGQVKMIIMHLQDWDSPYCNQLDWIEYDDKGNLMHFETKDERIEWYNGMWNKYYKLVNETEESYNLWKARFEEIFPEHPHQDPDTNKKDFPTMWECALYVKNLITIGALNLKFNEGYQWATKHCTIQGADIDNWKKLKKNYENALARNESRVLEFEGLD